MCNGSINYSFKEKRKIGSPIPLPNCNFNKKCFFFHRHLNYFSLSFSRLHKCSLIIAVYLRRILFNKSIYYYILFFIIPLIIPLWCGWTSDDSLKIKLRLRVSSSRIMTTLVALCLWFTKKNRLIKKSDYTGCAFCFVL